MTVNTNGGGAVLLAVERRWECPNCPQTAVTRTAEVHTRFHTCRSGGPTGGMWAPMIPAGARVGVRALERDDYVAGEDVQTNHAGRPVMAIVTTRDDGEDRAVYAPCATASAEDFR